MDVKEVKIDVGIPSSLVRMVALQPFIRFPSNAQEPFRWSDDAVAAEQAAIDRTLDIAQPGFGGPAANFTLFPEYSIPGVDTAIAVNARIAADVWSSNTIVIGGIHGLSRSDYKRLRDELAAEVSTANAPDCIPADKWVNCCVVWVKDRNGVVKCWLQPKLRPARTEANVPCDDMFCGSTMYVFTCEFEPTHYPCRFVTFVCFDWVARDGGPSAGSTVRDALLSKLTDSWYPQPNELDWVFVVEHNPNPNHKSFLDSTFDFLTKPNAYPFVQRDKAVVVHANTAASESPAGTDPRGFSACVFSPSTQFDCTACRPTVRMQPGHLQRRQALGGCKDVVFREMGECIHDFIVRVPRFVNLDATDRSLPVPSASVHPVCKSADPRLPGGPVPAAVKWLNDALDTVKVLSETSLLGRPLMATARSIEPAIILGMRLANGDRASKYVDWATSSSSREGGPAEESRRSNADAWLKEEADALEHVLHSLTCLGLAYCLESAKSKLHCALDCGEVVVQVVAIRGDTHEDCRKHFDMRVQYRGTDPVLVIARDRENNIANCREFSRIDDDPADLGVRFLDYQTLIARCRSAIDVGTLKGNLDEFLPGSRRII